MPLHETRDIKFVGLGLHFSLLVGWEVFLSVSKSGPQWRRSVENNIGGQRRSLDPHCRTPICCPLWQPPNRSFQAFSHSISALQTCTHMQINRTECRTRTYPPPPLSTDIPLSLEQDTDFCTLCRTKQQWNYFYKFISFLDYCNVCRIVIFLGRIACMQCTDAVLLQ